MRIEETKLRKVIREIIQEVDISRRSFLGSLGRGLTAAAIMSFLPREVYAKLSIMPFAKWKEKNNVDYDDIYSLSLPKKISSSDAKHARALYSKHLKAEYKIYVFKTTLDNMINSKNHPSEETIRALDARIDNAQTQSRKAFELFYNYCESLQRKSPTPSSDENQELLRKTHERLDQEEETLQKTRDILRRDID